MNAYFKCIFEQKFESFHKTIASLSASADNSFFLHWKKEIVTFNKTQNPGKKGRVQSDRYLDTKGTNYDFDARVKRTKEDKSTTGESRKRDYKEDFVGQKISSILKLAY